MDYHHFPHFIAILGGVMPHFKKPPSVFSWHMATVHCDPTLASFRCTQLRGVARESSAACEFRPRVWFFRAAGGDGDVGLPLGTLQLGLGMKLDGRRMEMARCPAKDRDLAWCKCDETQTVICGEEIGWKMVTEPKNGHRYEQYRSSGWVDFEASMVRMWIHENPIPKS